jgi:ribosomal protein S18 acetylase RimI-like enzyme
MSIAYRTGGIADATAVDAVFRTSFCDTFAHLYRAEDLDAFLAKFTRAAWESELGDPAYSFLIAETAGDPVGYVKLGPLTLPVDPNGVAAELRQLYVLKGQHGSGVGAALMDWAVAEAKRRQLSELYLTVYTDNHRARRFYERYGFVAVGRYEFMVGSHADEDIIMKLSL